MKLLLFQALTTVVMVLTFVLIIPTTSFSGIQSLNFRTIKTGYLNTDTIIPVIKLEKTSFENMAILFISDTAQTTEAIGKALGKGYGELMQYIQENSLQARKFIAWYYSIQPPWNMDIAVETDKIPAMLTGRIKSRTQTGGKVVIAHMWGPYDQVSQAYIQIEKWLKANNAKSKGSPFEVYLNDPATVKDPLEIRTDIYQPLE